MQQLQKAYSVSKGGAPKESARVCNWGYRSSTAEFAALSLYASTLRLKAPLLPLKTCARHRDKGDKDHLR